MVLGVLAVLTSLAVASVSVWLVPPYLAVMGLLLLAPGARRKAAEADLDGPHSGRGLSGEPENPERESEIDRSPTERAAMLENEAQDSGSGPLPSSSKTKRGKGRGRKGKVTTVERPSHATWVRIGPGKFVRTEMLSSMVEVEVPPAPSDSVVDPTGASALVEPDAPSDEPARFEEDPSSLDSVVEPIVDAVAPVPEARAPEVSRQERSEPKEFAATVPEVEERGDGELEDVGAEAEDTETGAERAAVAGEDVGVRPVAIVPDAGRERDLETVGLAPPTTSDAFAVSPPGMVGPRVIQGLRVGSGATFARQVNRSGRTGRTFAGARPHARRNALRFRQACRTFPPRSPPASMR
jgi:hypothetical protein